MKYRISTKWLWGGAFSLIMLAVLLSQIETERTDRDCLLKAQAQLSSHLKTVDLSKCFVFKGSKKQTETLTFIWYKTWVNTKDTVFLNIEVSKTNGGEDHIYYSGNQDIWKKLLIDDVKKTPPNGLTKHQLYILERYKKYKVCNTAI